MEQSLLEYRARPFVETSLWSEERLASTMAPDATSETERARPAIVFRAR